ncbi:hypothetical protein ACSBR1_039554 [Camellia fascicularis]
MPRRAAEKPFPPLDYSMQSPTQELVVLDLHDNTWTFHHIYRGQPKRHCSDPHPHLSYIHVHLHDSFLVLLSCIRRILDLFCF